MAEKTEAVNKKALEDVKKELALQLSQVIHKVRSYVKSLQPGTSSRYFLVYFMLDEGTLWKALQRFCSAKGVHDSYDCNRHYTNCLDLTYLTYNVTLPEADCCMACATKQPAGSSFITANFQRTVAGRGLELYLDFNDNPRFYGQAPDAPVRPFLLSLMLTFFFFLFYSLLPLIRIMSSCMGCCALAVATGCAPCNARIELFAITQPLVGSV